MLSINMSDVMNVINSIRTYLIAIGAIIIVAILIQLLVSKMKKPGRRLIRGSAFIAAVAGICICVNRRWQSRSQKRELCFFRTMAFFLLQRGRSSMFSAGLPQIRCWEAADPALSTRPMSQ